MISLIYYLFCFKYVAVVSLGLQVYIEAYHDMSLLFTLLLYKNKLRFGKNNTVPWSNFYCLSIVFHAVHDKLQMKRYAANFRDHDQKMLYLAYIKYFSPQLAEKMAL